MPILLRETNRRCGPQAFAGLQLVRAEFAHELPGQQGLSLVPAVVSSSSPGHSQSATLTPFYLSLPLTIFQHIDTCCLVLCRHL